MANLDFYAVESDIRQLAEFLFANGLAFTTGECHVVAERGGGR
jgi:hypothetical protein